ncbi:hypothetical protein B0H19DRAFT_166269 [Mycena capillaripes]|nr:hypothetical protein B0H19DRAFT_166269 [Mycena capillaripes]
MPWNSNSDGMPGEALRQFSLVLNERLDFMCQGAIEKYAFTGYIAHSFRATSSERRDDGSYHYSTPPPPTSQRITIPGGNSIEALVLECKVELKEETDRGCGAFDAGLANIHTSPEDIRNGRWYHTRTTLLNGQVRPRTSTYVFQRPLGQKHVFHIIWNTDIYPPPKITTVLYPANIYIPRQTTIPLIVNSLDKPSSSETTFPQAVLAHSSRKGKGRAFY